MEKISRSGFLALSATTLATGCGGPIASGVILPQAPIASGQRLRAQTPGLEIESSLGSISAFLDGRKIASIRSASSAGAGAAVIGHLPAGRGVRESLQTPHGRFAQVKADGAFYYRLELR